MGKKFSAPRGTNDILPSEVHLWQSLETEARELLKLYGYKEIRTPYFEESDLFVRSMGQTSDVVVKQMLNLSPQNKEGLEKESFKGLSLRPESTASVVRSYIQNGLDRLDSLSKLFYIGPMFRGERPQKGRLRQFHQIGVEAIGPGTLNPYLDAEVIALSVNLLKSFGINKFELKINTLGSSKDKENFSTVLKETFKSKLTELCGDCQQRFERNVFRILDCKNKHCQEIVRCVNVTDASLCEESKEYFDRVKHALDALKIDYTVCPHLVRGLDYYTHTVFELSSEALGSQNALGAGGRYDNLVSTLGGPQADAVGFALGIERILLASSEKSTDRNSDLEVFLIALDEKYIHKIFLLVQQLRSEGLACDMSYRVSSVKSQMRMANKSGAVLTILYGEEEDRDGKLTVKHMESGEQKQILLSEMHLLKGILKG